MNMNRWPWRMCEIITHYLPSPGNTHKMNLVRSQGRTFNMFSFSHKQNWNFERVSDKSVWAKAAPQTS